MTDRNTPSPVPSTMLAARVHRRGDARVSIDEVPTPAPGPGQVLIRVESAAVNFSDVKRRRGDTYPFETEFPYVPGGEIAGHVVAVGPGVAGTTIGAAVFALAGPNGYGGHAQFAVSYAPTVVPVPAGMDLDVACVLTVAGTTAKLMLTETARLQRGQSVLVTAGAGGVGGFAIQIARQLGAARVVALVGDPSKVEPARSMGAHAVVVATEDWPARVLALTDGRGVDVALEAQGAEALEATLRCLAPFGRLVVFGAASGRAATLSPGAIDRLLYAPAANQSIAGFNIGHWFLERPDVAGPALAALVADVTTGVVRTPNIRTLALAEAQLALELLETRASIGKLVLKPWR